MAQEEGESWWSSWTTGILENVREKTTSALEFVQNDLSEFVTTIQHDASIVIADSATAVNNTIKVDESENDAGKLKRGFSGLLTSISTTLHQAAESSVEDGSLQGEVRTVKKTSGTTGMPVYDRTQARLQEIQINPETYQIDPEGEAYQTWCNTFELDGKKGEISELLVNNADIRRLYTKFVPSVQSHSTFWHRYFYKVHGLEMENKRLADIVARANQTESQDLGWDDEDDDEEFIVSSTTTETQVSSIVDSKQTIDDTNPSMLKGDNVVPRHEFLQEKLECTTNEQEIGANVATGKENTAEQQGSRCNIENVRAGETNGTIDKKTIDDKSENNHSHSSANEAEQSENEQQSSGLAACSVEAKLEEYKSDSSDSNSWIRVSDKEGSSTNSSSSVVVVSEKEKRLSWDDNDDEEEEDKDDEDDDFVLNEDISNEDVEKLVQSITANEIDSDEDDWEDWD